MSESIHQKRAVNCKNKEWMFIAKKVIKNYPKTITDGIKISIRAAEKKTMETKKVLSFSQKKYI